MIGEFDVFQREPTPAVEPRGQVWRVDVDVARLDRFALVGQ